MKTAGIVCEYNPMHNGHVYHIEKTRKAGATHIVCVMSGNFVQRGECAFADKWTRANIAVHCGADLVIDLPVPWSCDSAKNFAFGAVSLLNELSLDVLSFGSETDDISLLKACAELDDKKLSPIIEKEIKEGASYPLAFYNAVMNVYSAAYAEVISSPNNTLAIEYIKALNLLSAKATPLAVKRKTSVHDDLTLAAGIVSAAAIRNADDFSKVKDFMPEYAYGLLFSKIASKAAPARAETGSRAVLSYLRRLKREEIERYVYDERGLSDRIFSAVKAAVSLDELYENVKTKNVTMAKVRRSIMRIYLGITPEISIQKPPYIRVLAANKKGLEIIKNAKTQLPIVTKHSQIAKLSDFAKEVYDIQCRSSDLYGMFTEKIRACSSEQTSPVIIIP